MTAIETDIVLAAAETPLQLMNLMALLLDEESQFFGKKVNLAIYKGFPISEELLEGIKSTELFNLITVIEPYYRQYQQYKAAAVSLRRAVDASGHWKKFGKYLTSIPVEHYSCLIGGVATVFLMDLKQRFVPDGETYFYEEGEGSYLGNFVKSAASNDRDVLVSSKSMGRRVLGSALSMLSHGTLSYSAHALYLYRPELVEGGIYRSSIELRRISAINKSKAKIISSAFNFNDSQSSEIRWAFLGNPDTDLSKDDQKRVRDQLVAVGNTCQHILYRPHPRSAVQASEGLPDSIYTDKSLPMWEIACADGLITEDSVLFGYGSTAQTNPKKMFDLEPYVVSLHKLISRNINTQYAEIAMANLKRIYSCPEKVIAPNNMNELLGVIEELPFR